MRVAWLMRLSRRVGGQGVGPSQPPAQRAGRSASDDRCPREHSERDHAGSGKTPSALRCQSRVRHTDPFSAFDHPSPGLTQSRPLWDDRAGSQPCRALSALTSSATNVRADRCRVVVRRGRGERTRLVAPGTPPPDGGSPRVIVPARRSPCVTNQIRYSDAGTCDKARGRTEALWLSVSVGAEMTDGSTDGILPR